MTDSPAQTAFMKVNFVSSRETPISTPDFQVAPISEIGKAPTKKYEAYLSMTPNAPDSITGRVMVYFDDAREFHFEPAETIPEWFTILVADLAEEASNGQA